MSQGPNGFYSVVGQVASSPDEMSMPGLPQVLTVLPFHQHGLFSPRLDNFGQTPSRNRFLVARMPQIDENWTDGLPRRVSWRRALARWQGKRDESKSKGAKEAKASATEADDDSHCHKSQEHHDEDTYGMPANTCFAFCGFSILSTIRCHRYVSLTSSRHTIPHRPHIISFDPMISQV